MTFSYCFRLGRFKVILNACSGLKKGRLLSKGIYTYYRWKPFYLSWGLRTKSTSLLRTFNTKFLMLELAPIRLQVFATPADIWAHWQDLKARKTPSSASRSAAGAEGPKS